MKYRSFGKLDWQASALGFGVMRMPTIDGVPGSDQIDEQEGARMIYSAIEGGVNYLDTAYPYHRGESEKFLGRILQHGWREKVRLATKLPQWLVDDPAKFDQLLDEQLERLNTAYIDFYLIHALDKKSWKKMEGFDVLRWAEKRRSDGSIGHIGFSFHDDYEAFKTIVDAYDWDFCQIQYNYMDIENQAGVEGLRYAAQKGLAVVIMEPLLGGRLAVKPPPEVQAVWDQAPIKRTPADWALQWLWNQPEVSLVLSGMSTMQQVEENLASASRSGVSSLNAEDEAVVDKVRQTFNQLCLVACTSCQYCQPCPNDVNIPLMFELYNAGHMYGVLEEIRKAYQGRIPKNMLADQCTKCRECEDKCPQHLPICDLLEDVDRVLAKGMPYPA
jgi:uncharacterized protein